MRYKSLDSLRGVAALAVVVHHAAMMLYTIPFPTWINATPLRVIFDGNDSVLIFFALSGFVLFLTVQKAEPFGYVPYLVRRFMRLYVPFAAAILGSALLYVLVRPEAIPGATRWLAHSSWQAPPSPSLVGWHLALTDDGNLQGLDNVMWSLVQEARFSLVFPVLAWCVARNWLVSAVVAAFVSVAAHLVILHHAAGWRYDPAETLQYLFLFVGGAALALNAATVRACLERASRPTRIALWVASFLLVAFPVKSVFGIVAYVAAISLVALCFADRDAKGALSHPALTWLGRVSYSLYLVHVPILVAAAHLFYGKLPLPYIVLGAIALSLVVSEASYRFIEKPAINVGRKFSATFEKPKPAFANADEARIVRG